MKYSALIMGLAAVGIFATPAKADTEKDTTKTRTVVEQVGYVETISYPITITETFARLDTDRSGLISFNEYRNGSQVDEPYGIFLRIDANRDDAVDIAELNSFSKTKGGAQSSSRFNFNQKERVALTD